LEKQGGKLRVVSIGTAARVTDFVAETGFPVELLYADPENVTYDALGFYNGVARTFFNPATPFAIKDRLSKNGAADLKAILPRWKPWIPPKLDQGLQQGGVFVFKGDTTLLEHKDEATGAHLAVAEILKPLQDSGN